MATKEMPRVKLSGGYPMIEDGRGGWRHIDAALDAEILGELQLRLPKETMDALMAIVLDDFDELGNVKKLPGGVEPIAATPTDLLFQRLKLKNFARDGNTAMAAIRALPGDWKVRKVGDGDWDFAVSKDGIKWHLFDPGPRASAARARERGLRGLPAAHFEDILDLTDIITDAVGGLAAGEAYVAAAGAVPGGPVTRVMAGSAAAGGTTFVTETMRQMIGEMAGIEENVDLSDAAVLAGITTLFSAAGPVMARGLTGVKNVVAKKLLTPRMRSQIREAMLEFASGLSGTGSSGPRMRPERVFERRIKAKRGILSEIPGVDRVAAAMRRLTARAAREQIPEQKLAMEIEDAAAEAGVFVDVSELIEKRLKPLMRELDEETKRLRVVTVEGSEAKIASAENVPAKAEALAVDIVDLFSNTGGNPRRATVEETRKLKQLIQSKMKDIGAIKSVPGISQKQAERKTVWQKILNDFEVDVRVALEQKIEPLGMLASDGSGRGYVQVMRDFSGKMKQLSRWKHWLGVDQEEAEGIETATKFLRTLHTTPKAGFKEAADSLKASTGIDVVEQAETAMVSELFGERGAARIVPRFNVSGDPRGSSLGRKALTAGTLGAGGFLLGGPAWSIAGLATGGALSSEAGQLAIARRAAPAVKSLAVRSGKGVVNTLEQTARGDAIAVMQSIARHFMQGEQQKMTPEQIKEFNRLPESERRKRMGGVAPSQ